MQTLNPDSAMVFAARQPAVPAPTTNASYFSKTFFLRELYFVYLVVLVNAYKL
jgi:hypothetical protein